MCSSTRLAGSRVLLATYMNESGQAVRPLLDYYKTEPGSLIVVHDELDLPFGTVRIKQGGGDNGHNGLRSITRSVHSPDYIRIRIGIGRPVGSHPQISSCTTSLLRSVRSCRSCWRWSWRR
ncbi:MAG: aminoacyl-tRNA hydrolase [Geodermatophilaceae bacterium]